MKSRDQFLIIFSLIIVTAAIYAKAAFFPFLVIDDGDYVTNNVHVMAGITSDSIKWAFTAFHSGNWHPLTWLSLMMDSQLFGRNPMGFHLVNVAFHALNSSLLFVLLRSITGSVWRSAFVAACFALHPLHVESVAWVAERKDVLSTLFWMLTLIFYSSYVKDGRRDRYLLSLAAFALGLMSKPMLVTLPVILILLDYWPLQRFNIQLFERKGRQIFETSAECGAASLIIEKVPFIVLAAASSIVTLYAQQPGISSLTNVPLSGRFANALWAPLMYMAKMLLPFKLAIIYPLVQLPLWQTGCAAAVLCLVLFLALKHLNRYPYLAVGWFWYLITLLPVIGIIQVGRQSMADRYTYIPIIGLLIMISWGAAALCLKWPKLKNMLAATAGGVLLFFAIATWNQLGYWRDNVTLFSHALNSTENNYFAHYSLGLSYEKLGKPLLAITEYQKSVAIEPRDPIVHFDLAYLLDAQGDTGEAIRHYVEAITLDPAFTQGHFSLAIVLDRIGSHAESLREFSEAVRLEPDNPKFHNNFGIALAQQGQLDEAIAHFSRALQLNPNDEKANENLQTALQQKKITIAQ